MNDAQLLAAMGTDAAVWASEFVRRFPVIAAEDGVVHDAEGLMVGWFANAIEAGRDAGAVAGSETTMSDHEELLARADNYLGPEPLVDDLTVALRAELRRSATPPHAGGRALVEPERFASELDDIADYAGSATIARRIRGVAAELRAVAGSETPTERS